MFENIGQIWHMSVHCEVLTEITSPFVLSPNVPAAADKIDIWFDVEQQ